MSKHSRNITLFDREILAEAAWASFRKLDPRILYTNPVMLAVELVAAIATILFLRDLAAGNGSLFAGQLVV